MDETEKESPYSKVYVPSYQLYSSLIKKTLFFCDKTLNSFRSTLSLTYHLIQALVF